MLLTGEVVRDADDRLVDYGVPLQGKDTTITFRSLGAMTSGYTLKEAAGEAYAYNDYGIQLYEYALSEYVFRQSAEEATAEQFRPMQFEDEWGYYQVPPKRQRIMMSIRDYARLVWMWHNRGAWNEEQGDHPEVGSENTCIRRSRTICLMRLLVTGLTIIWGSVHTEEVPTILPVWGRESMV